MMRRVALTIALLALLPFSASAKPVISDLSQHDILISSSFTGTKLILFGAQEAAGELIVVVRGPARDFTMRKKKRIGGIWVNHDRVDYKQVPDYYAIAATKPLDEILPKIQLAALGIGTENLAFDGNAKDMVEPKLEEAFRNEFLRNRTAQGLYVDNAQAITFMGNTLFKTTIPFPDTLPRGDYTAETYLVHNGHLVGVQSTPLRVAKTGLDAFLYHLANDFSVIYGLLAVGLAISAGWCASALFKRI